MGRIEFDKENIYLNLKSISKEEVIKLAGNKLLEAGYVTDGYIESMLHREELLSTYMDYGIAIPHGDRESQKLIIQSGICVLQFKDGIKFGEGKIANIIIAAAGKNNNHLKILSGIAQLSKDPNVVDEFKNTDDVDYIYNEIKKYIN